jgi:exodeoxyribonuclease-3
MANNTTRFYMKIISYNVNGIRAAMTKGFTSWLKSANPDVLCLQEIKAEPSQINISEFEELGYQLFWYPAQKRGYSGVAIFSKHKPKHVEYGCGISTYDEEGRVIRIDFDNVSIMSVYFPSGTSGDHRQDFKYRFLDDFITYINHLKKSKPNLIICGDINICHKEIDIHNPVSNKNTTGFLPPERAWVTDFLNSGFVDSFRAFNEDPHQYTWWSYRFSARKQNKGWRIDYQLVAESLKKKMKRAAILSEAHHSDHCPTLLEIDD